MEAQKNALGESRERVSWHLAIWQNELFCEAGAKVCAFCGVGTRERSCEGRARKEGKGLREREREVMKESIPNI